MTTILFPSPIFGPIHSRRLGTSLGINLLPETGKFCSFDCVYCECGFNLEGKTIEKLPTREAVKVALEAKLKSLLETGVVPDVFTFAGNGEPTAHPQFSEIIADTLILRDSYFPKAKVSVLSNAAHINKPNVFEALLEVDNNILKLDTVNEEYIRQVDKPVSPLNLPQLLANLEAFKGKVIIQTMFMKGLVGDFDVDNSTDFYLIPWIEAVKKIAPQQVMIYTIDRETPTQGLKKTPPDELDRIVLMLEKEGLKASASY